MEHLMHLHFLFAIHQVPLCGEVLASKMFAKLHVCLAVLVVAQLLSKRAS